MTNPLKEILGYPFGGLNPEFHPLHILKLFRRLGDLLPWAVVRGCVFLTPIFFGYMSAEPPRHLDAVKHELFYAIALRIATAGACSCTADMVVRSEGVGRLARDSRVLSAES